MTRLRCVDLRLRWPSGFEAGPLDLDLGPGVHHLRGRNGSGKSTLLRCLCGASRRSTGVIGIEPGGDPRRDVEARRRVALLSAEPELPGFLTVDEAWAELAAIRGRPGWDGRAVRERLGIPDLPLAHCSAGQRRLAELLAALAGDPRVLLLDEPFANLDPVSCARLAAELDRRRAEVVVLVTQHGEPPVRLDSVHELAGPGGAR